MATNNSRLKDLCKERGKKIQLLINEFQNAFPKFQLKNIKEQNKNHSFSKNGHPNTESNE